MESSMESPFVRIRPAAHGQGAFASQLVRKGQLLGYYFGEALDQGAFAERFHPRSAASKAYVYILRDAPDFLAIDAADATQSSWARFINSPRGTQKRSNVRWSRHVHAAGAQPRVEVRATRRIAEGEELLIDYGRRYPWATLQL